MEAQSVHYKNEIIVQLHPEVEINAFLSAHNQLQFTKTLGKQRNIHLFQHQPTKVNKDYLLQQLIRDKDILHVQFNAQVNNRTIPNDLNYPEQWDMDKIAMPEAWALSTGGLTTNGDTIVIAILDSGFDITHPDLTGNVWHNHADIPGDSIDNDGNGYIDDHDGWNFREDSNIHGLSTHGHAVSGIAGASGNNNIGVTGINWNIKLMLLDTKTISSIIAAYEYLLDLRQKYNESNGTEGAFVVATNASWGIENQFCDDQPIIRDLYELMGAQGILTAAGTANTNYNVDLYGDFPTACTSDYLITVTNTLMNDEKAQQSGFGPVSIDMGVPGDDTYTIRLNSGYGVLGDNSAATPHLTGAIGLMYSILCSEMAADALVNPSSIAREIKDALMQGVDPITGLSDLTKTGGRLNVANSGYLVLDKCQISTGPLGITKVSPNPASEKIKIEFQSPDFNKYTFLIHNTFGQLIFEETVTPNLFSVKVHDIEVKYLATGLYTLSIRGNNRMVSEKFLVVH
jgi:subtilisin family serine protease